MGLGVYRSLVFVHDIAVPVTLQQGCLAYILDTPRMAGKGRSDIYETADLEEFMLLCVVRRYPKYLFSK